jgi:O-antigen ligase
VLDTARCFTQLPMRERVSKATLAPLVDRQSALIVLALAFLAAVLAVAAPLPGVVVAGLLVVAAALVSLPLRTIVPAMVFLAPLRLYVHLPLVGVEVSEAGLLLFAVASGLCVRRLLWARVALTRWEWTIVLWWCWLALSWTWSVDRKASLHGTYQWTLLFAAILLATEFFAAAPPPEAAARRIITAVLALVAFWSAVGFLQAAIGLAGILEFLKSPAAALLFPRTLLDYKLVAMDFNWRSGYSVRPFGPFINATEFGAFTALGLGMAVAVVVSRSRLAPRWLALLTAGLALSANIASLKATGWVAAVAVLVTVFIALGGSVWRVVITGFLALVAAAALVAAFRQPLTGRMQSLARREGVPLGAVGAISRVSIWAHYTHVAFERPITGSGLFTANTKGPLHWTVLGSAGVTVANRLPTENGYLTAAIEAGFVGLGALVVVVGGAAVVGLRLARRAPLDSLAQAAGIASVGIVALLVCNVANDDFAQETNQFLLGTLLGIILIARRLVPGTGPTAT